MPQEPTPHPGIPVTGGWIQDLGSDALGNVYSFDVVTNGQGQEFVKDGRIPALWETGVTWNILCGDEINDVADVEVTIANPNIVWTCELPIGVGADTPFSLAGSTPSTFGVQYTGISSTYGMPQINVYQGPTLVSQQTASVVSSNGTTASFPFPASSSGALGQGFYTFNLTNKNSAAVYQGIGTGYFSIGSNSTSQVTPYGIDAFDTDSYVQTCTTGGAPTTCWSTNPVPSTGYIDTLATPGQVCLDGSACVAVGATPTAVKAYGASPVVAGATVKCTTVVHTITCTTTTHYVNEPRYAIATNYGSNTASIVALPNMAVSATLAVGQQPVAVALDSTQSYAYVANYGSSSITKIDLATQSVVGTLAVGAGPASVVLDPGGTSIWVGGLNYISKISLSTFTVSSTTSVSGQVTALGVSAAQNSWVFTTISTDLSTFRSQDVSISSPGTIHRDATMSTAGTFYIGSGTTSTPPPYLKSSVVITASSGNGVVVTSSPTGFAVLDIVAHTQIMQGTTASPVRGIAVDPLESLAYLTAPDSNSLITVPLPAGQ